MSFTSRLRIALVSFGIGFAFFTHAEIKIPPLTGPVIDEARILSSNDTQQLESILYANQQNAQVQIWIVPSTKEEPIESLSLRAVEKWKLGSQKGDNGLLILVAVNDRKMRIEVGQGLEGDIPDALTGRWIENILRPAFRAQNFAGGLAEVVNQIYLKRGVDLASQAQNFENLVNNPKRSGGLPLGVIIELFFGIVFMVWALWGSRFRRSRVYGSSGWSGGSWSRGSGSTFGGSRGGGWSGGGGGFSGGGSSGSW